MCLPVGMISAFAGWFVSEGQSVKLVVSDKDQLSQAMSHLTRIGLDKLVGGYAVMVPAAANGVAMNAIPMIDTDTVELRLENGSSDWMLFDVRYAD